MFCKRCGTQIDENSNFCSVCGVETSTEKRTGEDGKILLVAEPQKKW